MNDRTSTVVESDGIRVEKSFTRNDFPVPAVTFELTSARDHVVTIRLTDTIPDAVAMETIGFHPAYGSEHWTAYGDHRVEFERTLEPAETVETIYGVRTDDPDPAAFLTEPIVETAARDAEIEDVLGPDGAARVREVLSTGQFEHLEAETPTTQSAPDPGQKDPSATTNSETTAESETAAESTATPRQLPSQTTSAVTRREPDSTIETPVHDDRDGTETHDSMDTTTSVDIEADRPKSERATTNERRITRGDTLNTDVAAELAAAIRTGTVEQSDLETLRSALGTGTPPSVDVRLDRLQARVGELDAYTDAFSALINEEGPGEAVFTRLDAIENTVASVETRLDAAERAHAALASDLQRTTERLTELTDRLDEVDSLEDRTDEELAALESDIEAIKTQLSEFETFRRRLNEAFDR